MNSSAEVEHIEKKKREKPAKERRVRLTQKAIVTAAATLFAEKGFGSTSLDDIAEVLGVTKGALYYHVKNKEEILRLIYLSVLNVAEEPLRRIVEADTSASAKLRKAIQHHVEVSADRSPAITVFYRENPHLTGPFAREITLRQKDYEKYFETIIEDGLKNGDFKAGSDPKIITFGILGMCHWIAQWYKPSGQYSPLQIADMFTNMIENGLIPALT